MQQCRVHYAAHTLTPVRCGANVFLGIDIEVTGIKSNATTMRVKIKIILNSQIKDNYHWNENNTEIVTVTYHVKTPNASPVPSITGLAFIRLYITAADVSSWYKTWWTWHQSSCSSFGWTQVAILSAFELCLCMVLIGVCLFVIFLSWFPCRHGWPEFSTSSTKLASLCNACNSIQSTREILWVICIMATLHANNYMNILA